MKQLAAFLRSQSGSLSVEAMLWLPVVVFSAGMVFDGAQVFHQYPEIARVVQDTNRRVSIDSIKGATAATTEALAEAYVRSQLGDLSDDLDVDVVINEAAYTVTTTVSLPSSDLRLIGWFADLLNIELSVSAAHIKEDFRA